MAMLGNSSFPEILQISLLKPAGHQSWSTVPFIIERVVGDPQRLAGTRPATSLACLATLNQRLLCLALTLPSVPRDSTIPYHWWNGSPWRRYKAVWCCRQGLRHSGEQRKAGSMRSTGTKYRGSGTDAGVWERGLGRLSLKVGAYAHLKEASTLVVGHKF